MQAPETWNLDGILKQVQAAGHPSDYGLKTGRRDAGTTAAISAPATRSGWAAAFSRQSVS